MSIDYVNQFGVGMGQGASGGIMGMALGGVNGLMQGVNDEMAMNAQYFQQARLNQLSEKYNLRMLDAQSKKNYEMWLKTNYPAQVEQMRLAGLNPALMYGKGGGMGANVGNATGGHYDAKAGSDVERMQLGLQRQSQAMNMSLLNSQKANIDADTKLKESEANKLSGVDTDKANAEIQNILASTENTKVKTEGEKLTNILTEIKTKYADAKEGTELEKLQKDVIYAQRLIEKIDLELPFVADQADALLNKTLKENRLLTANANEREWLNTKDQRSLRTQELQYKIEESKAETIRLRFENSQEQQALRTFIKTTEARQILAKAHVTEQEFWRYLNSGVSGNENVINTIWSVMHHPSYMKNHLYKYGVEESHKAK